MDIPSWQALQEKLHEKLEDIYNDRDEVRQTVQVGKYFKYYLPNDQHLTVNFLFFLYFGFKKSRNLFKIKPSQQFGSIWLKISLLVFVVSFLSILF